MALTQWQLNTVTTDTIASGDFVAFSDEGESGDPVNKLTVDNLMETGLSLVTEDVIAVASDYILFLDGGATGSANKEQFADVMTAVAGTGISASSGVLNVDASQTQITAVGTIATGVWQGTDVGVAYGGTGASTLDNLITMGTHTTGNYVATVTAGTGLTSNGATSGESITHSLSVDASQGQITTVGALNAGSITSGFTSIDVGSGGLTTTGAIAGGTIDATTDFTIGGTVITDGALADGAFTLNSDVFVANGKSLVIGHDAVLGAAFTDPEFQVLGTTAKDASILIAAFSATVVPRLILARDESGGAIGSYSGGLLDDGDEVGRIVWSPSDGVDMDSIAAEIVVEMDGTSASNDSPGRLIFKTTPDDVAVTTEALRLDSSQNATFAGDVSSATTLVLSADPSSGTGGSQIQFKVDGTQLATMDANSMDFASGTDVALAATKKLYFDGTGDTYIYEESADDLHIVVGGATFYQIDQDKNAMSTGTNQAPNGFARVTHGGNFTSDGTSTIGIGSYNVGTLTGAAGDTDYLVGHFFGTTTTTQTATEDIALVTQMRISEPVITDNLTGDITVASTVYITGAPTEGETNAAIYVASGAVHVASGGFAAHSEADDLVVGGTSGRNGLTIVSGTSSGDKASIFFADSGGTAQGFIRYNNNDDSMNISTSGTSAIDIDSAQNATFAGDVILAADKSLKLPQGANVKFTDVITQDSIDDHDAQGIIFTFQAGSTVTPFSPVYIGTDDEVHECDADAIATMPCIGVSTNTSNVTDGNAIEVMMLGIIRDESFTDFGTNGAPVYVSTTVGTMTNTAPSGTDDVVQVVGHSVGEKLLFVQPCLTTIEHA